MRAFRRPSSGFRTRRIRKVLRPPLATRFSSHLNQPGIKNFFAFLLIFFIGGYLIFQGIQALNISSLFSFFSGTFGRELKIDRDGRTNLLLLGMAGKGHEGETLTDSVILASINHRKKQTTLFSIPRDLYVETKEWGGHRVNALYDLGKQKYDERKALEFVRFTMSELFDIPIHYVGKIDFLGFEKAVDFFGGISVNVAETINDPFYPKDGTYDYEPFLLPGGFQILDGKTALKYVRSRKTSSDFERANRQQQVLLALKQKAFDEGILRSPTKLKRLYRLLREHFETNMDLREIITLASFGAAFDETNVFHFRIHDDPAITGGFLYTPLRELYGGAYILLPASNRWDGVKKYIRLIFEYPEWLNEKLSVQVLNGSKQVGVAATTKVILQRYGISAPRFGNAQAQGLPGTTLFVKNPAVKESIKVFEELMGENDTLTITEEIPIKYLEPPYQSTTDFILEIGENFLPVFDKLDVFRNIIELNPPVFPSFAAPAASENP